MGKQLEYRFYLPGEEPQIPLAVKYDHKHLHRELKVELGVDMTGAALAVAAVEAQALGKAVSYSRAKSWYHSGRHPLITYRKVISQVDHLDAIGAIRHFRQAPGGREWQSAFEASPDLVAAVQRIIEGKPRLKPLRPLSLTIIRGEDGKPIDFKATREVERRDRRTEGFNDAIGSAEIVEIGAGQGVFNLACPMARIFNREESRGGRFYGMGTSWQNIKSEARRQLTINGEPVVELDFKTLHPAILYAEAGADMPGDCYAIDGWPRDLVKIAVLTLINAKTEHAARMSIAHSAKMATVCTPGHEAIPKASALIEAIKRKHTPIAAAFHSDAGARLMRKDSEIAEAVMMAMITRRGIVTLPVHDSFLVPASKRDELEAAMMDAAHEIGLFQIQIEAKI